MRAITASPARRTSTWTSTRGEDFEREIVVKVNVPEVLRAELARPSWKGETVALGTNTDPYQWVEGRYKLMRGIWEALRDARNPCSILTKSPLLLRDLDLMKEIAEVTEIERVPVGPDARREGVAGDRAAHAEPARAAGRGGQAQRGRHPDRDPDRAADARASTTRPSRWRRSCGWRPRRGRRASAARCCSCSGSVREIFFDWLREHRPDLLPRYERLYRNRARVSDGTGARSSAPPARRGRGGATRTALPAPGERSAGEAIRTPSASGRSKRPCARPAREVGALKALFLTR